VLFRLEPQTRKESTHATLLIQGTVRPNWKSAGLYEEVEASEIKVFEPKFRLGDRLRFRLRANPTVKKFVEGRKNGSRVSVTGEEGRLAWLKRKADQYGFKTDALGVVSVDEGTLIGKKGPLKMALQSVRYEGHLEVMNPEALAKALTEGIGPAKGLGFGLLSLAPA
jgi:CRISPR system Cascade subunit CasE